MKEKIHRGIYYGLLRPLESVLPRLMVWGCNNLNGIHPHRRLTSLYKHQALVRPQYYLGIKRAFDYANQLGLSQFSILEFGVAEGNGILLLENLVNAVQTDKKYRDFDVQIIGFDTFEGLPTVESAVDGKSVWSTGDYPSNLELLQSLVSPELVQLKKGLFGDTIPACTDLLQAYPPLFIINDSDLYHSTVSIFEGLFPDLVPSISYWYFDDMALNAFSEHVGERRAINEFNAQDEFGYEFVLDYKAANEPIPNHIASRYLYNCIHNESYVNLTRQSDGVRRLPLDVAKHSPIQI